MYLSGQAAILNLQNRNNGWFFVGKSVLFFFNKKRGARSHIQGFGVLTVHKIVHNAFLCCLETGYNKRL